MSSEFSPSAEKRPFTKLEALLDLVEMAHGHNWTIAVTQQRLADRWGWKDRKQATRFLEKCRQTGKITCPKSVPNLSHRGTYITVLPPSGYGYGQATKCPQDVPKVSAPHYSRDREILEDGFSSSEEDTDTVSSLINPNPELESSGGVKGIVPAWDLPHISTDNI